MGQVTPEGALGQGSHIQVTREERRACLILGLRGMWGQGTQRP